MASENLYSISKYQRLMARKNSLRTKRVKYYAIIIMHHDDRNKWRRGSIELSPAARSYIIRICERPFLRLERRHVKHTQDIDSIDNDTRAFTTG